MDSQPLPPPYGPLRFLDLVDINEIEFPPSSPPPAYSPSTVPAYCIIDPLLIDPVTAAHILTMLHPEEYELEVICPRQGFLRELTSEELDEVATIIISEFLILGTTRLLIAARMQQDEDVEMQDAPELVSEDRAERRPRYGSPAPFRGDPNPPNIEEEDKNSETEEGSEDSAEGELEPMSQ